MDQNNRGTWIWIAVIAALLFVRYQGCDLTTIGPIVPAKPPLIVMLYEAHHGDLPSYATGAANDLAASGREVRAVDDDKVDGTGEVPDWLKPALVPGRQIMGIGELDDALILLDGERVVKAIKLPESKEAIMEACK